MTKKQRKEMYLGMVLFILIVSSFILLSGCGSVDGIKIGGGYTSEDGTKIEGDIEIVLSETDTKTIGAPCFTSSAGEFILLSEKQVSTLIEKVEKIEPEKKTIGRKSFAKLMEILGR